MWTDGSCTQGGKKNKNTRKYLRWSGGYGGVIRLIGEQKEIRFYGGKLNTTNNEMELLALKNGIEIILGEFGDNAETLIYTDSTWVYRCLTKQWNCTEREELRNEISSLISRLNKWRGYNKIFGLVGDETIKSHSKLYYNDVADDLSNRGREEVTMLKSDVPLKYEYCQL